MSKKVVKPKATNAPKALTKTEFVTVLSNKTGLTKAQTNEVLSAMSELVEEELKSGKPVAIPGLVKISVSKKAAVPAKPWKNPFTGEETMSKAKPACKVVKVKAQKSLKDMVAPK